MDFISNSDVQNREMLKALGIESVDQLFSAIPKELLLSPPAEEDGLSEWEGMQLMKALAAKNSFSAFDSYLGAGAYEHHVPSLVSAICSKSEFLTSYTPYQAEGSQGVLQAMFEYQSAICALTGMDVSNASLYDGASACAEAILMALRLNQGLNRERPKLLISRSLHPHYRAVVEQYVSTHALEIEEIPFRPDGSLDTFEGLITEQTAAVLVQSPNFLGVLEEVAPIAAAARKAGALTILCANPLSYGLFASAGELGADIAVGDGQPLGIPLQFGGPYVGYMACRQEFVRQLPGRIVGETVDSNGRRGYVLTLQTREQHIRREKATSNICTSQTLASIACLVAQLWYGKEGLRKLALTNYQRAHYLKNALQPFQQGPCFNEFRLAFSQPIEKVQSHFRSQGIEPGLDLGRYFPELRGQLLVAATETKSKEQLDRYIACAKELVSTP
ncbi:MAG: aminomethyl-transferring glycine dehydrogenase subunit GcvPA [Parachlamydia sp.]|nr:aminomethyl-transferring glycine dehydrogenase subunit GcvPA [Parachlamydia sp.]